MEFRYKVLVIDDDSSVSFYIKSVLEAQGYDVIVAKTAGIPKYSLARTAPTLYCLTSGFRIWTASQY